MAKRSYGKAHTTFHFTALSSARFRASVPKITGKSMPTGMSWDLILPPQRSEHSGSSQIGPLSPPQQAYWNTAVTIIHHFFVLLTVLNI